MKTALVLSGGGSLGMAHVGVAEELSKQGCQFDFFAGVSAGAIIAAGLACGKSVTEIEKQINFKNLFKLFFNFSSTDFGIVQGEKIWKFLDDFFEGKKIEDLDYPLWIGTTDFSTGERILLNSGSVSKAVRASLSVPVLFEPLYYQGRWLVDGGLSQNFPLDIAIKKYKGEKIIGVNVATVFKPKVDFTERKFGKKIIRLRQTLERTFRIFFQNQQNFSPDPRVTILKPDLSNFTTLDVNKLEQIKRVGIETARKNLPK